MGDSVASPKKWYVIRSVSGQENKVKSYIEYEITRYNLGDYIERVLVPTEKVLVERNGKKVTRERVYMPGYVMIQADLSGEIPHIIKSINGVIGFLGETVGGEPVPLRKAEVNRLLGKVDEFSEQQEMVEIPYEVGQVVNITDGPFKSFTGTIEKIDKERRKLTVIVKVFERRTPLELNYTQVEKL